MFRLSLALGIPVDELRNRLSDDIMEWYLAFSTIEPFGAIHDERRMATLAVYSLMPHMEKGKSIGIGDISTFLEDCADVGTDEVSADQAQADKAKAVLESIVCGPGWTKVEPGKE